jgi:hypothetical protein
MTSWTPMALLATDRPDRLTVARACALSSPFAALALVAGCHGAPHTAAVIENDYAAATKLVVYRALWQTALFQDPVAPGSVSDEQDTSSTSSSTAYVVLAPGWDPSDPTPPASFVFLQSRAGLDVHLDQVLRIPVDDTTFIGNCAAGSFLSQAQADFITQRIFGTGLFPDVGTASFHYDPATCTTTPIDDAGPP